MGATEAECRQLAKTLPFEIWDDDIYSFEINDWAITIVFSTASEQDRLIIDNLKQSGWIARWLDCEARGFRCTLFKPAD